MTIRSIRDIASAVRGRRLDLGLSQAELARRGRVSRKWISELERGKPTAELGLVLRVLDELGLRIELGGSPEAGGPTARDQAPVDLDALLDELRPQDPRQR